MAVSVHSTMIVSEGTVLNFTYNTEQGNISALWFGPPPSGGPEPSLINHGEMRYTWSGTSLAIFMTFDSSCLWEEAVIENYGLISMIAPNAGQAKVFYGTNRTAELHNSGTIIVQAKSSTVVYESWNPNLTLTNAAGGLIQSSSQEHAIGLYLANGGTVENAGEIRTFTTGGANVSRGAFGISMPNGHGNIHNSGLIHAYDADPTTKYAAAIAYWGSDMVIVNDGTLRGEYAIRAADPDVEPGGPGVFVENNGQIEGDVYLGLADDLLQNDGGITGIVDLGLGNDIYDGQAGTLAGEVWGGGGYDRLNGGGGADRLVGGAGHDRLSGGNGGDDLDGGADRDDFVYSAVAQSTEAARDRIRGFQTGLDTIELRYLPVISISWTAQSDGSGSYNLVSVVTAAGTMSIRVDGALAMADFVVVQDLQLNGTPGNDTLTGGPGNDVLNGLAGADQMAGKEGDDVYFVDDAGDAIVEGPAGFYGTAFDTVAASVSYTLTAGAHVERLSTTDQAGTAALALTGNALDQTIVGNAGANVLAGGGGADILDGAGGDDLLIVDSADDIVREAIGGGDDIVRASTHYALTAGAAVEILATDNDAGTSALNLTGNEFGQTLRGNVVGNGLYGGGGDDVLFGGAGEDLLNGGEGRDVYLYLDAGESVAGASDLLFLTTGEDVIDLRGTGAISVSWYEHPGWISDFPALLRGYVATIETAGGTMTLKIVGKPARTDFLLGGELVGTAGGDTIGGGANADVIDGRDGDDVLSGLGGADFIAGKSGNDLINGGAGADQIWGGLGQDRLFGGEGADIFLFAGLNDSRTSALRSDGKKYLPDFLGDFVSGEDRIDLSGIDAMFGTMTDEAFTFIGAAAFSRQAGQLRFEASGGSAQIFGDVDGDGYADFQIAVAAPVLVATDFIL